jgi:4'-phosphopantetheinyl transferase
MSVIALARHAVVGADIERCRPIAEQLKIATQMFGDDAARAIATLPPAERDQAFLRLWTAGEAYVKALGVGLALRGRSIPVRVSPDSAQVAFRADFPDRDAWQLAFPDAPPGYVCCVATADRDRPRSVAG